MFAAPGNNARVLKFLVDSGADIDRRGTDGYSALLLATSRNSHEALQVLLETGASYLLRVTSFSFDEHNWTTLHTAAWFGDIRTLEILTEAPMKGNSTRSKRQTTA